MLGSRIFAAQSDFTKVNLMHSCLRKKMDPIVEVFNHQQDYVIILFQGLSLLGLDSVFYL